MLLLQTGKELFEYFNEELKDYSAKCEAEISLVYQYLEAMTVLAICIMAQSGAGGKASRIPAKGQQRERLFNC